MGSLARIVLGGIPYIQHPTSLQGSLYKNLEYALGVS